MHLPAFIIRNKVNTIKQNIQSVRIKMAISLSVLLSPVGQNDHIVTKN